MRIYSIYLKKVNFLQIKSIFFVALPEYINSLTFFIILYLIGIRYNAEVIGQYSINFTIAQIASSLFGGVMLNIIRRDFIHTPIKIEYFYITIWSLRLLMFLIILICLGCLYNINLISYSLLLLIIARLIDSLNETYYTSLLSLKLYNKFSILKISQNLLLLFFIYNIEYSQNPIIGISNCFLLTSIIFSIIGLSMVILESKLYKFLLFFKSNYIRKLGVRIYPLLLGTCIYILGSRINIFIVKFYCNEFELGIFSLILNIFTVFTLLTNAISSYLFNIQIEILKKSRNEFQQLMKVLTVVFLCIGILSSLILFYSGSIIDIIFNNKYDLSYYLKISSFSLVPIFCQIPYNYLFTIFDDSKNALKFSVILFFVTCILYAILTNLFKLNGALYAYTLFNLIWFGTLYFCLGFLLNRNSTFFK